MSEIAATPNSLVPSTGTGLPAPLDCLAADEFIKDVFRDSDTDMMVLSFVPSAPDSEPLSSPVVPAGGPMPNSYAPTSIASTTGRGSVLAGCR